jgi:hypothetical protein
MKLVARLMAALALVAYAAPALPCGAEKANKTVQSGTPEAQGQVAKTDKEKSQQQKGTEKSEKAKGAQAQQAQAPQGQKG